MKSLVTFIFACVAGIALLVGCGKSPGSSTPPPAAAQTAAPDATNTPAAEPDGPPAGEKACFACKGTGAVKCMAPGCVNGAVDCPGPCLKLDRGVWVHMDVPGHPPTDIWQEFNNADGTTTSYSQGHVGHVIVMQNGRAVDSGTCKICGGTGKVPCSVCKGTGQQVCPICKGSKYVPEAWTPTDNPWLNSQPDLVRLNDGRIFFGKIIGTIGTDITIKTRDGKFVHVNATNVAPKSATISTNAAQ
jgi:hypothetical protein